MEVVLRVTDALKSFRVRVSMRVRDGNFAQNPAHPGDTLEHPQATHRVLRLPPYLQTRRFQPGSVGASLKFRLRCVRNDAKGRVFL